MAGNGRSGNMRLTGKGRIKALYDEAKLFLGEARWLPMCDFGMFHSEATE